VMSISTSVESNRRPNKSIRSFTESHNRPVASK
jgi:hypothetical protein